MIKLKDLLPEKAVSKQQQKFFGVVKAMQSGDTPKEGEAGEAAKTMSKKEVDKYAGTKHKGLPDKVNEIELDEKKKKKKAKRDKCYYKVKGRYKVWPSAYGSLALSACRNVGAANWGEGGKKS